jgi:hypothetical protein
MFGFVSCGTPVIIAKNSGITGKLKKIKEFQVRTSFHSHHSLFFIKNHCVQRVYNESLNDTVRKTVKFIRTNTLNHGKFSELLESLINMWK